MPGFCMGVDTQAPLSVGRCPGAWLWVPWLLVVAGVGAVSIVGLPVVECGDDLADPGGPRLARLVGGGVWAVRSSRRGLGP